MYTWHYVYMPPNLLHVPMKHACSSSISEARETGPAGMHAAS